MDPISNLAEQRDIAQAILCEVDRANSWKNDYVMDINCINDLAERLAELVLALDEWRRKGGFDPYS